MPADPPSMSIRPGVAVLSGHNDPILWLYRPADPHAVTLAIRAAAGEWVEWRFLRELLAAGLLMLAGDRAGDIQLRPDGAAVRIDLRSPTGSATLFVATADVQQFLALTYTRVRLGGERPPVPDDPRGLAAFGDGGRR